MSQSRIDENVCELAVNRFAGVLEKIFLKYGAEVLDELDGDEIAMRKLGNDRHIE